LYQCISIEFKMVLVFRTVEVFSIFWFKKWPIQSNLLIIHCRNYGAKTDSKDWISSKFLLCIVFAIAYDLNLRRDSPGLSRITWPCCVMQDTYLMYWWTTDGTKLWLCALKSFGADMINLMSASDVHRCILSTMEILIYLLLPLYFVLIMQIITVK
jgi:hypothetical protein